jgi:hypothetical protein
MNQPASLLSVNSSLKVTIYPEAQYSVFSAEVKYIMLCMVLWRWGEYPVDKSWFMARNRVSKGYWFIHLTCLSFVLIKKYD